MTYIETINYLQSFINYEKDSSYPYQHGLQLERIKDFLAGIGNPQSGITCLHIAGTKGKGSTCAFLTYILREAGFRVGLYTSPHLSDVRERIRILGRRWKVEGRRLDRDFEGMIAKREITELVNRLKPKIEEYNKKSEYGPLTFFEVYTAIAFTYFKEKKTDFAVLETGMGGRLDATNAAEALVCAITPISYEHTEHLGNTLTEIAREKAGIIKRSRVKGQRSKVAVIAAPQEDEAMRVIRKKCREAGAKLYEVGRDILYERTNSAFKIKGLYGCYPGLKINLTGGHQLANAATAVGMAEALRNYNIRIGAKTIRKGLYHAVWPGRCEAVAQNPAVVLDGAQNAASAGAIKRAIKQNFRYKKLILVLGVSRDKDIKGICSELKDLAGIVILTQSKNPRAAPVKELARYFDASRVYLTYNVKAARSKARALAEKQDLILVTGSLFVVGEFRDAEV